MREMKAIYRFCFVFVYCVCIVMLFAGCAKDDLENECGASGCFSVLSEEREMCPGTRADKFKEKTRYALWVIDNEGWTRPMVEALSIASDENGELSKTVPNTFPTGDALNFYAVTWGTTDAPVCDYDANGVASFRHTRHTDNNTLPDLRRAQRTSCTAANTGGKIVLPFEHTLVKLRYEVLRHDDPELEDVRITDITVHDHEEGTLNIATGEYIYDAGNIKTYPVSLTSTPAGGIEITTVPREITDGNNNPIETLVFPNVASEGEYLTVSVTVKKKDQSTYTTEYQIPTAVVENGEIKQKPFPFRSNHEYVLQLTVMTDKVRIVAIVPQKYDWIDVEESGQLLGNPIVFAGSVWLDRNLGAPGYDITDAATFDKSVGYFYQTCRNVPYWAFCWPNRNEHYTGGTPTAADRYKISLADSRYTTEWNGSSFRPYPIVSERLQPYLGITNSNDWVGQGNYKAYTILEPEDAEKLINDPNKKGSYSFKTGNTGQPWWNQNGDKAECYQRGEVEYYQFWDDPTDQPVPAGWRLPTGDEFRAIFPATPFAGNIGFSNGGDNTDLSSWNSNSEVFGEDTEVIRMCVPFYKNAGESQQKFWKEFDTETAGDFIGCIPESDAYIEFLDYNGRKHWLRPGHEDNARCEPDGDPAPGYHSVYIISRKDDDVLDLEHYPVKQGAAILIKKIGTIYGIKKVGTPEAYRMRWKTVDVAGPGANHPLLYLQVNIYPATEDDNLTDKNFKEFDWEHPSATMNMPISGLQDGKEHPRFCNYGTEVIYASSTVNKTDNNYTTTVLRMKMWGFDNDVNIYMAVVDELINHGKQIRLVRE